MRVEMRSKKTMTFCEAIASGWRNKWNYAGRASRAEFWWNTFALAVSAIALDMAVIIIVGLLAMSYPVLPMPESDWYVMGAIGAVLVVMFCALLSRRLHDTGHSNKAGIALVALTPMAVAGSLVVAIMLFPQIVDEESYDFWHEMAEDWRVALLFGGSMIVCIAYLLLLVYVVPLLFKEGVTDNNDEKDEVEEKNNATEKVEEKGEESADSTDLMANWKVKMEVFFDYDYKIDEDTGRFYHVYKPTQFEFTFAEALKRISENGKYYEVEDLLLHNIVVRDAMRRLGVAPVIEHIKTFAPNDETLMESLDNFQREYPDGSIGNIDIQVYSVFEDVKILGHTFHGLNDIMDYKEMMVSEDSSDKEKAYSRTPKKRSNVHVGEVWASYPCFDSDDFANETRTYQNYIVRNKTITNEDLQRLKALPSVGNHERINEKLPTSILPMVYYQGDGCYMLVATAKTE